MTAPTQLPDPVSTLPQPSLDFSHAQTRLEGILDLLKLERRILEYRFREPRGEYTQLPLAVTVLVQDLEFEQNLELREHICTPLEQTHFVDLNLESEAEHFYGQ